MTELVEDFDSIQHDRRVPLSVKELHAKRFQPRSIKKNPNDKKKPLKEQVSKPPRDAVKVKPEPIQTHFVWALVLTITCFFVIGPCWALYKSIKIRQMIKREELDAARHLSHTVYTVLIFSTVLAIFAWIVILFCSVGIVITGKLLDARIV